MFRLMYHVNRWLALSGSQGQSGCSGKLHPGSERSGCCPRQVWEQPTHRQQWQPWSKTRIKYGASESRESCRKLCVLCLCRLDQSLFLLPVGCPWCLTRCSASSAAALRPVDKSSPGSFMWVSSELFSLQLMEPQLFWSQTKQIEDTVIEEWNVFLDVIYLMFYHKKCVKNLFFSRLLK